MKQIKLIFSLVVVLSLVLTSFSSAAAAGPAGGWASGIACQNLDTGAAAIVTLTFYRQDGTSAIVYNANIPAGGSQNWLTTSAVSMPGFPAGFIGSGVISSTTSLACNLNTQSTGTGTKTSPYRMGTASGFSDAQSGPVMYIPQVNKNASGFSSYVAVQNTANAAVNVNVDYYDGNGNAVAAAHETASIPALSSHVFYQADNAGLPVGFNGGAKVTSVDGVTKLAALVASYAGSTSYTTSQFQSYNGFASGAAGLYLPRLVRKLVGNNSGIAIQNVGTVATSVTIHFNFQGTEYVKTSPAAIQPNASWLLYAPSIPELGPVDALAEGLRQGSAVVNATAAGARIVATVNETNNEPTAGNRQGQGSTYNAVLFGQQTTSVFFAQFTKQAANGIFSSGIQVSNTTGNAGTCFIEYAGQPALNETGVTLPANGSIVRWALTGTVAAMKNMNPGYNAAVKFTCTQPVTGIVNMSAYGDKWGDRKKK